MNKLTAVRVLLAAFFTVSSGCDADSQHYHAEKKQQQDGAVRMIPTRGGSIDLQVTNYIPNQTIYLNKSMDQRRNTGLKTDEFGNFSLIIPRQPLDEYILSVYDKSSNKWLEHKFTLSGDIRIKCNGKKFDCKEILF